MPFKVKTGNLWYKASELEMKRKAVGQVINNFKRAKAASTIQGFWRKKSWSKNRLFDRTAAIPERKAFATNSSVFTTTVSATPTLNHINSIGQGAALSQRIGNNVTITSVQIRGGVGCSVAALNTWEALNLGPRATRVAIVYDRAPNGSAPNYYDIWDSGSVFPAAYAPYANRVPAFMDRFVVLKEFDLNICAGGPNTVRFDEFIKVKLPAKWNSNSSGAIGGMAIGSIYVVFVDTNASGANSSNIFWQSKINFSDD